MLASVGHAGLACPAITLVVGATVVAVTMLARDEIGRAWFGVAALVGVAAGAHGQVAAVDRLFDAAHVVAAALWVGGVLDVAVAWHRAAAAGRAAAAAFARVGAGLLAVVVATGIRAAGGHLGDARLAVGSSWARVLAVKVVLVALGAAGGAFVRRRWMPRLEVAALSVVALLGLVLGSVTAPLPALATAGPLVRQVAGGTLVVTPFAPGANTVVFERGTRSAGLPRVVLDGRAVQLRGDGIAIAPVTLVAGAHRLHVGARRRAETIAVGGSDPRVVVPATLALGEAGCLDRIIGAVAAARALTLHGHPARLAVSPGLGCSVGSTDALGGRSTDWEDVAPAAVDALQNAGGPPPVVIAGDGDGDPEQRFADAVVAAIPTAARAAPTVAPAIKPGQAVLVATTAGEAETMRGILASAAASGSTVVLAPWLLDARVLSALTDAGVSPVVAAHRDPTDALAVDYRAGATQAGLPVTAAGLEGYVEFLAATSGRRAVTSVPALYTASRVGILPADLGHVHSPSGWAPGVALVRVG